MFVVKRTKLNGEARCVNVCTIGLGLVGEDEEGIVVERVLYRAAAREGASRVCWLKTKIV